MTRLGSCIQHEGKLQSIYYFDIDIIFEGICLAITCNGRIAIRHIYQFLIFVVPKISNEQEIMQMLVRF